MRLSRHLLLLALATSPAALPAQSSYLTVDARFRDAGSDEPGISLTGANWPGFTGMVVPHGAVFSR